MDSSVFHFFGGDVAAYDYFKKYLCFRVDACEN